MPKDKSIFNDSLSFFDPTKQKRKTGRLRVNLNAQLSLKGKTHKEIPCTVIDIGTGGIKIQAGTTLYATELVRVDFLLNELFVYVNGEVVRVSGKDIILKYIDLPDETRKIINEYIHQMYFEEQKKTK